MAAISPILSLGSVEIGAAATVTGAAVTGLAGMSAVTLSARLSYGAGGTAVIATVQTSLDQGATWIDIARMDFATAGAQKIMNLSGLTPRTSAYAVTPLNAEGANDGILGDRLRAAVVSTGTYTGSTVLSIWAMVR